MLEYVEERRRGRFVREERLAQMDIEFLFIK